jgi:hypothetical protein
MVQARYIEEAALSQENAQLGLKSLMIMLIGRKKERKLKHSLIMTPTKTVCRSKTM